MQVDSVSDEVVKPEVPNVDALRVAIGAVSAAYLVTAALGTWLAIRDDLAARPFGWETSLTTLESFLFGLGTALTAPLVSLLALVAANLLLKRGGTTARWATDLIALLAIGFFVGMLAEPITQDILDPGPDDPVATAIVIANLVLPLAMLVLAIRIRRGIQIRLRVDGASE